MENNKNGYPSWMVQESQSNSYSYPGNTIGYSHGPAKDGYGQITTGCSQETRGYFGDPYIQHSSGPQNTTGQNSWEKYQKLEFSRLCDRMKENTKEKKIMSYVGILRSDKGIVAFSDSRSTYENTGYSLHESDNEKKVFSSKGFVFVTYGLNRIYDSEGKLKPLQSLIDPCLTDFSGSYRNFFWNLQKKLEVQFIHFPNAEYHFLIGFKDNDGMYGMESCKLSTGGPHFSMLAFTTGYLTGGSDDFGPKNMILSPSMSVDKMKQLAQMAVNQAIEMGNLCLEYNPVGGAVQITTLI